MVATAYPSHAAVPLQKNGASPREGVVKSGPNALRNRTHRGSSTNRTRPSWVAQLASGDISVDAAGLVKTLPLTIEEPAQRIAWLENETVNAEAWKGTSPTRQREIDEI